MQLGCGTTAAIVEQIRDQEDYNFIATEFDLLQLSRTIQFSRRFTVVSSGVLISQNTRRCLLAYCVL